MAHVYLKHPQHGSKVAYTPQEVADDKRSGWVEFTPGDESEESTVPAFLSVTPTESHPTDEFVADLEKAKDKAEKAKDKAEAKTEAAVAELAKVKAELKELKAELALVKKATITPPAGDSLSAFLGNQGSQPQG